LMPLLAIVAMSMVTGAFSAGFDRYYLLRVAVAATALVWYQREYSIERRPTWSWSGVGIGVVVFVIWMGLEPGATIARVGFDPRDELSPTWAGAWLFAWVLGSVFIISLAEELAFRGYLIRRLIAADFRSVPRAPHLGLAGSLLGRLPAPSTGAGWPARWPGSARDGHMVTLELIAASKGCFRFEAPLRDRTTQSDRACQGL